MNIYTDEVQKILEMSMNDKEIKETHYSLYKNLLSHYFTPEYFNTRAYNEGQNFKKSHFSDIIPEDDFAIKVKGVTPDFYHSQMIKVVIEKAIPYHLNNITINGETTTEKNIFQEILIKCFSEEDILKNTLGKNINIEFTDSKKELKSKIYPAGMKITRFFTSFLEFIQMKNRESEKTIGKFRLSEGDLVDIYISKFLPSFIMSGLIGSSCLSPEGSNEQGSIITSGYPNAAVVHDENFQYRAWLFVDKENKYYSLAKTYPYENYFMQLSVIEHMNSLGYKQVNGYYFSTATYTDLGSAPGLSVREELKDKENYLHNHSADGEYTSKLFEAEYVENKGDTITDFYECDSCGNKSCNPNFIYADGLCENCYNESEFYFYCENCGDRYHNDDGFYDEETGNMYCSSCHRDIRERKEQEQECIDSAKSNDDENDDSKVVNYSLLDKGWINYTGPTYAYYGISINNLNDIFIKYLENNFKTPIIFKEKTYSIDNKLDNYVFMTIAEKDGLLWNSGDKPKDFNVSFPISISIYNGRMSYGLPGSYDTSYRQLYKAALNLALIIKNGESVENENAKNSDFMIAFMNSKPVFSDFFTIGARKSFQFEDQKTYDAFMIIIEKLGCIWQSKNRPLYFNYTYNNDILIIGPNMEMSFGNSSITSIYTFDEICKFVPKNLLKF